MDKKKKLIRGFLMLALRVLFIALALLILFGKVFLLYRVHGMDMYPAVKDGDLLLAYRIQKSLTSRRTAYIFWEIIGRTALTAVPLVRSQLHSWKGN